LPSNPYEPLTILKLQDRPVMTPLNWRAILIAIAISFGVSCVLGIGCGIMAISLTFAAGSSITTYIDSPILMVAGFVVGFIPSIVGAFYLGKTIESRSLTHTIIYSVADLLILCLFMLIPSESGTSWTDIGYCALLIPVSVACVLYAFRSREMVLQTLPNRLMRLGVLLLGMALVVRRSASQKSRRGASCN